MFGTCWHLWGPLGEHLDSLGCLGRPFEGFFFDYVFQGGCFMDCILPRGGHGDDLRDLRGGVVKLHVGIDRSIPVRAVAHFAIYRYVQSLSNVA